MKLNSQEHAEARSAHVDHHAREEFTRRRAAVIADDVVAIRDTENELLERFANSNTLKDLIKSALSSAPEITGRAFTQAVVSVIQDHADEAAEKNVVGAEQDALEALIS